MTTVREFFDTDSKVLTVQRSIPVFYENGRLHTEIIAKIAYDFEANARYWYIYIPETNWLSQILTNFLQSEVLASCNFHPKGDGFYVELPPSDHTDYRTSETLQFTKQIKLYLDSSINGSIRASLVKEALGKGFYLSIYDRKYAADQSRNERPLAFISHDSRDKDDIVRDLASELTKLKCRVWYDEYSLKVGDSLRASIEKGLKESHKCILILSPHFLSNTGWARAEFDSIFTREILEKENVIFPIWHNVDSKAVYDYSPRMSDRFALASTLGAPEIAKRLALAIKNK